MLFCIRQRSDSYELRQRLPQRLVLLLQRLALLLQSLRSGSGSVGCETLLRLP